LAGAFDNEEAAAHTYDLAALKYWGSESSNCKLNFPVSSEFRVMHLSLSVVSLSVVSVLYFAAKSANSYRTSVKLSSLCEQLMQLELYRHEHERMQCMSREAYLAALRRKSSSFSRGASEYRGVAK